MPQQFIRVVNWASFQHYRDRNPPWIKLHRELLSSRTWVKLDDASRVLAIACMLLAAATNNKIPMDPDYLRRVAYLNSEPDFSKLFAVGFVELIEESTNASKSLAVASTLQAGARPETETEEEEEKRKTSSAPAEGVGEAEQVDPRHGVVRQLIQKFHLEKFRVTCPWDGSEGKTLDRLLSANPSWTQEQLTQMVRNRFRSEGIASDRPRKWLANLGSYAAGPQDRFNKLKGPHTDGNGNGNRAERRQADNIAAAEGAVAILHNRMAH